MNRHTLPHSIPGQAGSRNCLGLLVRIKKPRVNLRGFFIPTESGKRFLLHAHQPFEHAQSDFYRAQLRRVIGSTIPAG